MEVKESNEPMELNSDSASSSSDDEEEQALILKAEELERQISDNKYLYNAHEDLVTIYRQLGDLKSMRLALERFHEYFPLTPKMWLAWINDEKKLANSENEIKFVFTLFDRAVEDYLSVKLWLEYAQYSIGASDLSTTRLILEKGLTATGLHTAEASLLWDTLRELELAHLSLIDKDTEQWKEQILNIVEIFRRQLSVPLMDMENTYSEWTKWLKQIPEGVAVKTDAIDWGYNKALKILDTYKPFEEKLIRTTDETELLQIYKDYIKVLSDPSTILCVYERAVAQLCLNINIWLDYCLYALKLGDAAEKVSSKALRNCPWSEDLWIIRLKILEHLAKEQGEVMACFELAMTNIGTNQGTELWLSYLEYVNRTLDKENLHKLFDQALEQLHFAEGSVKVTKWYAKILAKNGDLPKARRLWKNVLKHPQNKTLANLWLDYINLERQYGDLNHQRSVFQKALTTCTDWPQYIADEWLTFERECGTLEDVIKCIESRKEIIVVQLPQSRSEQSTNDKISQKGQKRKLTNDESELDTKKSKSDKTESLPKKTPILKDPTKTVFISNLYPSINEKKLKKVFPNAVNIEVVIDRKGKSRCYGYVQFNLEEEVLHTLARDRELLEGRPMFISNCKPDRTERKSAFRYSSEAEANKLFVRGLPLGASQEDVEKIFKPYGAITARLVLQKSGQSKGLAYIEFNNEESAKLAMKKTDQMKIGEHTITVAISAPPTKSRPKPAPPTRHSRSNLQIPMIPRAVQVKNETSTSNGNTQPFQGKSNDDFRKMLFNK